MHLGTCGNSPESGHTGPSINRENPSANATAQTLTCRLNITLTDLVDFQTMEKVSFEVREVSGQILAGNSVVSIKFLGNLLPNRLVTRPLQGTAAASWPTGSASVPEPGESWKWTQSLSPCASLPNLDPATVDLRQFPATRENCGRRIKKDLCQHE